MEHFLEELRILIPYLRQHYHVDSLAIFGSYARGEQEPNSDLDLLVTFSRIPGLFRFIEIEYYLSDHLGIKVDLVMRDALKPRIAQSILSEAVEV